MESLIDHPLIQHLDKNRIKKAYESVNRAKITRTIHPSDDVELTDFEDLEKVVGAYEFATIDYWNFAFDTSFENAEKKKIFHQMCQECFGLLKAFPIPEDTIQKIIHVLKLLAYSYLGEKWENMKRYLEENDDIWDVGLTEDSTWDYRLFVGIYLAILYMTKKSSWDDLSRSLELITELRKQQKLYEKNYLDKLDPKYKQGSALQLASLYHLAKSVEITGQFMLQGTPTDVQTRLDYHFERALAYSQMAKMIELDIILRILGPTFKKMTYNSVWTVARRVNSKITEFTELITRSDRPVFEFLYPQRVAILEKGLLDPASRAVVVNMPTSSGKTIIAEFRILQAINTFGEEGKIVYVVPTRALVNQTASRLRRDLGQKPLNIRIEKMSGAVEIDGFEKELVDTGSFHILVTTPEKLQILIRHPESSLAKSLVLVIIDEAQNMSNDTRGLNLEMLLSIIKKDCERANILLLTPFIPNSQDIAGWLDPQNPKSINLELDWRPSDKAVGFFYAQGHGDRIQTFFKPLVTSQKTIELDERISLGDAESHIPISRIERTKYVLTSLVATQMDPSQNILILGKTLDQTWKIADTIYDSLPDESNLNDDIILVKRFVESELGASFPLVKYLEKRIGVHNAGLPDDVRELMEWLMERKSLRVLVATTTIAQGVNFPVSGILLSSYSYPYKNMPPGDFWNLLGRVGRIDQRSLGLVGLAVNIKDDNDVIKTTQYVQRTTEDLVSVLVQMIDKALALSDELDLSSLAHDSDWSGFVQYIAHMRNQSENLEQFIAEAELTLKRTYGYGQLHPEKQKKLLNAVRDYARRLDGKPHLSRLSDLTGFAPETIEGTIRSVQDLNIRQGDWDSDNLFSPVSNKLSGLMGIMLNMPEIKENLNIRLEGRTVGADSLGKIISDWVCGVEITEIASRHFGIDENAITDCVRTIYGKITNSATWGLAGIQRIPGSGLEFEETNTVQKRRISICLP